MGLTHRLLETLCLAQLRSSGGAAKPVDDGVAEHWMEFSHIYRLSGRGETLFATDVPADRGKCIGEGRVLLVISGAGCNTVVSVRRELFPQ